MLLATAITVALFKRKMYVFIKSTIQGLCSKLPFDWWCVLCSGLIECPLLPPATVKLPSGTLPTVPLNSHNTFSAFSWAYSGSNQLVSICKHWSLLAVPNAAQVLLQLQPAWVGGLQIQNLPPTQTKRTHTVHTHTNMCTHRAGAEVYHWDFEVKGNG